MIRSLLSLLVLIAFIYRPVEAQSVAFDSLPACDFEQESLQIAALVVDFASGNGCTQNLDTLMPIASVPKIFVAGAFLEQVALGNLAFETTMRFTADYFMGGRNSCLSQDMIGTSLTYGYLSDIMITCSDNSATWMLMDVMGWEAVQRYIDSLGIEGIGPVIPYSEVDRLKLISLDERWSNVPRGLASQFLRGRSTRGLVPDYFRSAPDYSREQRTAASEYYFRTYDYNTATPRAIAQYILKLRDDLLRAGTPESQVAYWLFNTLILTPRQFSVQALPGSVYVGAKNGFDTGLRAEMNVLFPSLWTLSPGGLVLVFAYQPEGNAVDADEFGRIMSEGLTETLSELSPEITDVLYPAATTIGITASANLSLASFGNAAEIENCAQPQPPSSATLAQIDGCWKGLANDIPYSVDDALGMGLILRYLDGRTHRFTFVYTAPDRTIYSYQWTVAERDDTHIYWVHPLNVAGEWQVDVYQNLARVYSGKIAVER